VVRLAPVAVVAAAANEPAFPIVHKGPDGAVSIRPFFFWLAGVFEGFGLGIPEKSPTVLVPARLFLLFGELFAKTKLGPD
jgi:hypothetical protein